MHRTSICIIRPTPGRVFALLAAILVPLLLASAQAHAAASALDQQRSLYRITAGAIARGDRNALARAARPLADYPLLPYLELAALRARLGTASAAEIDAFFARYAGEFPAERLRTAWLAKLAAAGRWSDYLRYEPEPPPEMARRCEHAWALRQTGPAARADAAAAALWQHPHSLPAGCNRVLAAWTARGNPDAQQAWGRFDAAMQAGDLTLARYVLRFLGAVHKADAQLYLRLHDAPAQLATASLKSGQETHARIAAHALARLAPRNAAAAQRQFDALARRGVLDEAGMREAAPRVAIALAAQSPQQALQWALGLAPTARSDTLAEDAMRYALRAGDWSGVDAALALAPAGAGREDPRWQYWHARAAAQRAASGQAGFAPLNGKRDWYGFLAADRLGTPYAMQHVPLRVEAAQLAQVEQLPAIRRARELYLIGEQLESRREWSFALTRLTKPEREAAATLAGRWGWHTLAITAVASIEAWDALDLRFPDPFEQQFAAAAKREKLDTNWLFAIARQESAMNPGARSPAGALGLMQVMPGTAQLTARKSGIPYKGTGDLLQPATNVVIGSRYMRMMLDDFSQNRVLAAAAYNAGPGRVRQWMGRFPAGVEHDVFVEAIPFRETRQYVQNVLSFAVIYAYLQGRSVPLVRADERSIGAHSR